MRGKRLRLALYFGDFSLGDDIKKRFLHLWKRIFSEQIKTAKDFIWPAMKMQNQSKQSWLFASLIKLNWMSQEQNKMKPYKC